MRSRASRIVTLAALATLASFAEAQPPYNLTLSGASPGGLWSLLGAGVHASVAAAYPGSAVTYQTSGGGLATGGAKPPSGRMLSRALSGSV